MEQYRPVARPGTLKKASEGAETAFRDVEMLVSVNKKASGSSFVSIGPTKVFCAIYGPQPDLSPNVKYEEQGKISFEVKFAPFSRVSGVVDESEQQEWSSKLGAALSAAVRKELYPKSVINVLVNVLEADGGSFGAAVIAGSLALADAGIEMLDLVSATEIGVNKTSEPLFVFDPTAQQCEECSSVATVAFMPHLDKVSYVNFDGALPLDKVEMSLTACTERCKTIDAQQRKCLKA